MSDIVERLKRGESCLEGGGKTCINMDAVNGCLCAIAADEITRLTVDNKRLRAAIERALRQLADGNRVLATSTLSAALSGDKHE